MSKRKFETPAIGSSELPSAGVPWSEVPWSEVPDAPCPYTKWLDGRQGAAENILPSVDEIPIPDVLLALPVLRWPSTRIKAHGRCSWSKATTG
jgi:hypothetical protein